MLNIAPNVMPGKMRNVVSLPMSPSLSVILSVGKDLRDRMRNRAKCKKCQSILESFHLHDYVTCKCGEISISGGNDKYFTYAHDFSNFIRIDDEEKEVLVTFKEDDSGHDQKKSQEPPKKATREDLLQEFQRLLDNIEQLPEPALTLPISHYDLYSFMLILSHILRAER
jgi:hypothetical protein